MGDCNSSGYYRVCLYNKKHTPIHQRFFRHRLVAEHFIPNPKHLQEVNHKDCNLSHNNATNLEWCSKKDNELHSRLNGTKIYKPFIVEFENGNIKKYHTTGQLASELHLTRRTILNWLQDKNHGYKNHGIISIQYIILNP